jgi:transcriptional regulator with XRE-family HTH domain
MIVVPSDKPYIMGMSRVYLRIHEFREALGLTQDELAERAGIRRTTVSEHETGRAKGVDFDVLDRLARALNTEPGFLVVRTPEGRTSPDASARQRGRPPRKRPSKRTKPD